MFACSRLEGLCSKDYVELLLFPFRLISRCLTTAAFARYVVTMTHGELYAYKSRPPNLRKERKISWSDVDAPDADTGKQPALLRRPKASRRTLSDPGCIKAGTSKITDALRTIMTFADNVFEQGP